MMLDTNMWLAYRQSVKNGGVDENIHASYNK